MSYGRATERPCDKLVRRGVTVEATLVGTLLGGKTLQVVPTRVVQSAIAACTGKAAESTAATPITEAVK